MITEKTNEEVEARVESLRRYVAGGYVPRAEEIGWLIEVVDMMRQRVKSMQALLQRPSRFRIDSRPRRPCCGRMIWVVRKAG